MKLRMRGETLRLRLTRGEVERLGQTQEVVETTQFPGGTALCYKLIPAQRRAATLRNGEHTTTISIEVPADEASAWAGDDALVCLSGAEAFSVDGLEILIEKDFTCVTPRIGEEELDTFPNPNIQVGT